MKYLVALLLIGAFLFTGCGKDEIAMIEPVESEIVIQPGLSNVVGIIISDNGISTDKSDVKVSNYYPGARAEIVYRVTNACDFDIIPEISVNTYADVKNYSMVEGYKKAQDKVYSWIETDNINKIKPGKSEDIVIALAMPANEKINQDKFAYMINVNGKSPEFGNLTLDIGVWWLVDMK